MRWCAILSISLGAACLGHARGDEGLPAVAAGLEERSGSDAEPSPPPAGAPRHEALSPPKPGAEKGDGAAERVPKPPPAPVLERPGTKPDAPDAQWVAGYWEWDSARNDYVWVTGAWQVPPAGTFWVNGYWRRDARGWFRVPGFWSARVDGAPERRHDWKRDGPPDAPQERVGPAPGPEYFYVPGVYVPDPKGDDLVWRPGFWYPNQAGWDWVPARWVRRPTGWAFRDGSWRRTDGQTVVQPARGMAVPPGYPGIRRSHGP